MDTDTNGDKIQKRKTLSLKIGAGSSQKATPGNKTIEVEIKRKRHGLAIDIEEEADSPVKKAMQNGSIAEKIVPHAGDLTDKEVETRIKVLQEARKSEEDKNVPAEDVAASVLETDTETTKTENEATDTLSEAEIAVETDKSLEKENIESNKEPSEKVRGEKSEVGIAPKETKQQPEKKVIKKEKIEPVVFRASEYKKKATKTNAQNKKTEPKVAKVAEPEKPTIPDEIPDLVIKENLYNTERNVYKQRERLQDDYESPRKMRLVVKSRTSERRSQTSGKISRAVLDRVLNNDMEERSRSMASLKRARQKLKNLNDKPQEAVKVIRDVDIPDMITVGELANRMAVRSVEVTKYLMSIGTMATINQLIDGDTAEIICTEFGHTPHRVSEADVENELTNVVDDPKDLIPRAPIVAIMGHVDHGKTTLLDTLRKTNIAQKEAGGITQHVAAYQIETKSGKKITFIDTPGHAAFAKIRARGAVITDIIILVVAADDGVKEQTIEVINQAKSQNVPLVVAINKIDKPNSNVAKIKNELMAHEIVLEDFGGETLRAEISAKQNINLDGLLETVLLQAEMLELKANEKRAPVGTVLESRVDKGKGVVASLIVQHGILKNGDIFVAGSSFGKVRTIFDDKGKKIQSAGPSTPVEIVGFDTAPEPGDVLTVVETEQKAREIADYRKQVAKMKASKSIAKNINTLMDDDSNSVKVLNILLKTDVYGSLEAIVASLEAIKHPEIRVQIVESGVGIISESDIDFAKNTNAIVIGFNVNTSSAAKDAAKLYGIKILNHDIIYHMTEEVKAIMGSMLSPIVEENYIGNADLRKIFTISRLGTIAGCYVTDGLIKRNDSKIKVMRSGKCVFEGKIHSMRHEKDEIKESRQGHECGILAEGFNDFKVGDQIECYEIVLKSRSVD